MTDTTCKLDDCPTDLARGGLGFCKKHYQRFVKHGDPTVVGKRGKTGSALTYVPTPPREKVIIGAGDALPCAGPDRVLFDDVLDLTAWWTGQQPGKGAQRVIDNAKAVCHACPLMLQCRARNRDLSGVVGGEYRPHTAVIGNDVTA